MRTTILLTAAAALALLAFALPSGQDDSPDARAKALLAPYAGTWETTYTMAGMPAMESKGEEVVTLLPHGLAMVIYSTWDMGAMGKYEGHGLMGFERSTGKWQHAWSDTMAPGLSVREGKWSPDGKSFIIEGEEETPTGRQQVIMTMHMDDADHMTWTMVGKGAAEGAEPMMTMKYTRKP